MLTTQFLLGSIPMVVGSLFLPDIILNRSSLIDLAYVVIFTGVIQYYLWNGLLRRGRVGKISTMAFAVPAVSMLIVSIQNFEIPSAFEIAGAGIMFLGIFISSWEKDNDVLDHEMNKEQISEDSSRQRVDKHILCYSIVMG